MRKELKHVFLTWLVPLVFLISILIARLTVGNLLFHSLAEFFTIVIGIIITVVSYFTYQFTKNNFLLYLGIGYFWIALLDFFHMLTFKDMFIYSVNDTNITLTFWILARFLEALVLISAPFINFSIISKVKLFSIFGFLSAFIYWLSFSSYSPDLYIEGIGLTFFKLVSEYIIIFLLIIALFIYKKQKKLLDGYVYKYMMLSILFSILAEFTFTLYADIHGYLIMLGHLLKFVSFWMIFLAVIKTSLEKPFMFLAQDANTYNAIPVPAVVVDKDGIIRQINDSTKSFLNLKKEEILHSSNHMLFHDKNLKESECQVCEAIKNGAELNSHEVHMDQYTYSFTVSPMHLGSKLTGAIQVCTDLSKRKHTENELKKLQTAIEQSPISIVITDVQGSFEYVNPQFLEVTGYSYEEVIGKKSNLLASGYTTKDEYALLWDKIKNHKTTWSGIFKNIKKNGEEFWESAIISPIIDENGTIVNYIGIKQDISEKVALESLVKNQEELIIVQSRHAAMGEMIAMIAHQWRQPLAAMASLSIDLQMKSQLEHFDLSKEDESRKYETCVNSSLHDIDNLIQNLSTTIDDFRNFYKTNKHSVSKKLDEIVLKSLKIIRASLINDNIKIIEEYNSKEDIKLYDSEIMQVILNILKNAQDNFKEKNIKNPYIKITTENRFITICDNGRGITEHIKEKIFQPYFSTKDDKNGTGLGLYMSKTIIEEHHNGELTAKNTDDGVCFIIELGVLD